MNAKERKLKREQEKVKEDSSLYKYSENSIKSIEKKKLISIPSNKFNDNQQNKLENSNSSNIIQDQGPSIPADNKSVERIKDRINKRKNKGKKEVISIKNGTSEKNMINNDTNLNNNSNNILNKLNYQASLKSNKISHFSSNKVENLDSAKLSGENYYKFLSKDINDITKEDIDTFLQNTEEGYDNLSDYDKNKKALIMFKIMNLQSANIFESNEKNIDSMGNIVKNISKSNDIFNNKQKKLNELKENIKFEENNLEMLIKRNKNETQNYIETIITLQNKIINSPIGDIISLEEENKLDDIKINNLKEKLYKIKNDNEIEKSKMQNIINKELGPLKEKLESEINEVQKLKQKLLDYKNKDIPQDLQKKVQVVMKYKTGL